MSSEGDKDSFQNGHTRYSDSASNSVFYFPECSINGLMLRRVKTTLGKDAEDISDTDDVFLMTVVSEW